MKLNGIEVTCEDCYFRQASLCALRVDEPCPIFRHSARGALVPAQPPRLSPRPLDEVVKGRLVAQVAAA
jgi:hypothetical protein